MKNKTIIVFVISVAVCSLAATYRFSDSAHAIGTIKRGGGSARHPVQLDAGSKAASLIVTARVIPPFRGDARVALEGAPPGFSYTLHNAEPAIRLPFHHRPGFSDNIYRDLRPDDKVALWVVMKRGGKLPAASMQPVRAEAAGSCCPEPYEQTALPGKKTGQRWEGKGRPEGKGPQLAFYDLVSNERLLSVPIRFIGKGGGGHGE